MFETYYSDTLANLQHYACLCKAMSTVPREIDLTRKRQSNLLWNVCAPSRRYMTLNPMRDIIWRHDIADNNRCVPEIHMMDECNMLVQASGHLHVLAQTMTIQKYGTHDPLSSVA
jgi:hypothetical protein